MRDDDVLRRMILALAARTRDAAGLDDADTLEVILPREVLGLDDLRRRPEALHEGTLTHFVAAVAGDILRDGVTFRAAEDGQDGIRVKMADSGVTVDLTDRSVADLLLRHLNPRFRALLDGVVG
jgi:V/A-type H+-transporting ATPase subunit E